MVTVLYDNCVDSKSLPLLKEEDSCASAGQGLPFGARGVDPPRSWTRPTNECTGRTSPPRVWTSPRPRPDTDFVRGWVTYEPWVVVSGASRSGRMTSGASTRPTTKVGRTRGRPGGYPSGPLSSRTSQPGLRSCSEGPWAGTDGASRSRDGHEAWERPLPTSPSPTVRPHVPSLDGAGDPLHTYLSPKVSGPYSS